MAKTTEEMKNDSYRQYTSFTNIYTDAIRKYDAIQLYTFKSMSNSIKEYDVLYKRCKESISKIQEAQNTTEQNQFEEHVLENQFDRMFQYNYLLHMIPSNLVVSLVTSFDQFLTDILTYLFKNINGQMNIIEESLKYNELSNCDETDTIQDFYIEKFCDAFFRKSHKEQFEWLDKKLSLNITSEMPNYEDFIFLCELRNLIVHNDSKPNKYFLKLKNLEKYKEYGFSFKKNEKIDLDKGNLIFLFYTIHLSTTYLFSILGQKYYSKDEEMMSFVERAINENIVNKLETNPVLSMALILRNQLKEYLKHSSDYTYIYKINLCIAYKKTGRSGMVNDVLNSMDWTNCSDMFLFAKYVLLKDKNNIINYMRKFAESPWKSNYQIWPLFDEIRNEVFFKEEYKKIFNEEFIYNPIDLAITPKDIRKVEKEFKKTKLKKENKIVA